MVIQSSGDVFIPEDLLTSSGSNVQGSASQRLFGSIFSKYFVTETAPDCKYGSRSR